MSDNATNKSGEQLKRELFTQFETTGQMVIDSSTLKSDDTVADADDAAKNIDKDVTANVPKAAESDVLMQAKPTTMDELVKPKDAKFLSETVIITPDDKQAFIEALLENARFTRAFSLYGGKICGEFQNRTVREHDAIVAYLCGKIKDGVIKNDAEYFRYLRALVLTAQTKRYMEFECDGMQEPLYANEDGTPPAWEPAFKRWLDRDDLTPGLTGPMYAEIRKFEHKYWTLIACADDANFFAPVESI